MDFAGRGVTATNSTHAVTVTVPGPVGNALFLAAEGVIPSDASIAIPNANDALMCIFRVPSPMLLDKVGFQVTTSGSGTCQWGLFDFTASATAATSVAGGTGALNSTGYLTIAATSAPVTISPGTYVLIVLFPAANIPRLRRSTQSTTTVPFGKFQASYTWTNTPNLTSGWTTDSVVLNAFLHGRLSSGAAW
jgi:hypothetical protein